MEATEKIAGIVTALPEERRAVLASARQVRKQIIDGIPLYDALLAGRQLCVIEGGMGAEAASRAARLLISARQPGLLLSAGFCGAIQTGAAVGDAVICQRLLTLDGYGLIEMAYTGSERVAVQVADALQNCGIRVWQGSFITTGHIISKTELSRTLPPNLPTPVLEMESAAVFREAATAGIAFAAIRTVSDDAAEELLFSLDELTGANRQISISKVLATCLQKPRIIPQLARLAANSAKAAKNLGIICQILMPKVLESRPES